ncbi:MAG: hypothetical protein FRX49_13762 [Trebouxia sp. A1-2]|nr:MAG: hypothetical protein FRX49_13762 [Trebouxia sp. A1-2]
MHHDRHFTPNRKHTLIATGSAQVLANLASMGSSTNPDKKRASKSSKVLLGQPAAETVQSMLYASAQQSSDQSSCRPG